MSRMIIIMALAVAARAAAAQDGQDTVARGAALAERWCSHCHIVGTVGGTDAVPPLATVAARRDPSWVRSFLAEPHGTMPDLNLSTKEIEALTAYLATLR